MPLKMEFEFETKVICAFEWGKLLKCDLKGQSCNKWAAD